MFDGTLICPVCRATVIEEEAEEHQHTRTWRIIGDVLWIRWYDGKWYSHDLPPTNRTTDEEQPDSEHYQGFGSVVLSGV